MVAVTWIQVEKNRSDLEWTFKSALDLEEAIYAEVARYDNADEPDLHINSLMWHINKSMVTFVSGAWNNYAYSSALLLDSNRQIVGCSGSMILQFSPHSVVDDYYSIPLDRFCTDEQLDMIYHTFRTELKQSNSLAVSGDITGYKDRFGQWIPHRLTLSLKGDETTSLTLDFDTPSDGDDHFHSISLINANILFNCSSGSYQTQTKVDRKLLRKCDTIAVHHIDDPQKRLTNVNGTNHAVYAAFDGVSTLTLDGETYYLAVGGVAFPILSAIRELKSIYLFVLIVMLVLFRIISRGFVKQHMRQLTLERDRRRITADAAASLRDPLNSIHDSCSRFRQFDSERSGTRLLDSIISDTEKMDETVRRLLTYVQTENLKSQERQVQTTRSETARIIRLGRHRLRRYYYKRKVSAEAAQPELAQPEVAQPETNQAATIRKRGREIIKIYCRAGIGLAFILALAVNLVTVTQADLLTSNMSMNWYSGYTQLVNGPRSLHSVNTLSTDTWDRADFICEMDNVVCAVAQEWAINNIYSSILLLDSNREVLINSTERVHGFGTFNHALTSKDQALIKECEGMAYQALRNHGVEDKKGYFSHAASTTINIGHEEFYLIMGLQGVVQQAALVRLLPIYCVLIILMLVLFFGLSGSFTRLYDQQLATETARQDLITAVAHEIKTPLGIVRNFCEGLQENINESKRDHYIDIIFEEARRLDEMLSDMVSLSELESGVALSWQTHSVRQIAEQVLARYQEALTHKGIAAEIVSSGSCAISCDKKLMEQVISNFLSNAVRHTGNNGEIRITVTDKGGESFFAIENSGPQIPADKIIHIWDPYYKTDVARSNPKGTGLGLSIAKTILTAHGFRYGVENTKSGVRFWFIGPTFKD